MLFLHLIELVDDVADLFGEVVHPLAELVSAGELAALLGEAGSLVLKIAVAGGDVGGAAL